LSLDTGEKVKGGANADKDRGVQLVDVLSHPNFLFRSTHTYPYDMRAGVINCLNDLFVFGRL
jgi:hypothetical protein